MTVAARTPQQLAQQHHVAQARIRALALRQFLVLWPLWTGDETSFARLVQATIPLVRVYQRASSAAAAAFYEALRQVDEIAGAPTSRLAPPVNLEQLARAMWATGDAMTRKALAAGQSPAEARRTALTRVSGAVTRLIVNGGRDTILDSVQADPHALGWARVTDGNPCAFCLTLASRGAVYKSEQTADFQAHDHCDCTAIPVYDGTEIPNLQRWKSIYNQAQNHGEASGLLQPGENTPEARINAVRQLLTAEPHLTTA